MSVVHISAQSVASNVNDSVQLSDTLQTSVTIFDSIVDYSKLFLNTPYRYGSAGENSFDCSGFTSFVYSNFGFNLDHSSSAQANQVQTIRKNNLQKGDLVFFNGRRRGERVGHVGIVVEVTENGSFNFIHAAVGRGVTISNSNEPYYSSRYVKAGRPISMDSAIQRQEFIPDTKFKLDKPAPVTENKLSTDIYHKVKRGESLYSIAKLYNTSVYKLKDDNHLKNSKILPNQKLIISSAANTL